MPVTRSASRAVTQTVAVLPSVSESAPQLEPATSTKTSKRKARGTAASSVKNKRQRSSNEKDAINAAEDTTETNEDGLTKPPISAVPATDTANEPVLLPAELTFSLEAAKSHLIAVDARFEEVFRKLPCKPFEHLERLEPFRYVFTTCKSRALRD